MVFSSLTFLFAFLPIALLGYYLLPQKLRIGFLLLVSLVFYAWGEPVYVLLMVVSVAVNWTIGLLLDRSVRRKKLWLILAVVCNLLLLGVFKYAGLFWDVVRPLFAEPLRSHTLHIRLPIGISFFTFQSLSYVIDLYRGKARVQRNPIVFGAYVSMFPQLIAGPIVRYVDIEQQLRCPDISVRAFADGIGQFVYGLAKKVLLANAVGLLWTEISSAPAASGIFGAWVGLLAYTFQIYFDFSGYSDMACGLGRMFGFRFVRNFNDPYIAQSISDFWRRWHISLSVWFREYVYIPLGGNRKGPIRQVLNLLIVWGLTGLWHGASWNFILWGLWFGVLLIVEKLFLFRALERIPRLLRHLYTMLFVMLGWCIFALPDFSAMSAYFGALTGIRADGFLSPTAAAWTIGYLPLLIVSAAASTPVFAVLGQRLKRYGWFPYAKLALLCTLFVLCIAALASQSYNPFIYFRF